MARRKEPVSPSRERYENAHPVVSVRIDHEISLGLKKAKEERGMSVADVLKVGLGLVQFQVKSEQAIRQEAEDRGWEQGNELAMDIYAVAYPCSKCKEQIIVTTDAEKKAVRKFLVSNRWGHVDCRDT